MITDWLDWFTKFLKALQGNKPVSFKSFGWLRLDHQTSHVDIMQPLPFKCDVMKRISTMMSGYTLGGCAKV